MTLIIITFLPLPFLVQFRNNFLFFSIFLRLFALCSCFCVVCMKFIIFNRFFWWLTPKLCLVSLKKGFRSSSSSCHCVIRTEAKISDRNLLVSNNTMNSGKGQKITTAPLKSIIAWSLIPITAPRDNCDRFFACCFCLFLSYPNWVIKPSSLPLRSWAPNILKLHQLHSNALQRWNFRISYFFFILLSSHSERKSEEITNLITNSMLILTMCVHVFASINNLT